MNRIKITFIQLFTILLSGTAIAQNGYIRDYESFKPYGDVNPSVESFALTKYGIVSPSLYTGTMSYSVPLFTYSDFDFSIPISVDYNYNGYRPAMASGSVGLGWALNCGGVITREVRGIPDEGALDHSINGWKATLDDEVTIVDNSSSANNIYGSGVTHFETTAYNRFISCDEYLTRVQSFSICGDIPVCRSQANDERYDLSPDIFHFNFLGFHGDFMIVAKNTIRVFNSNVPHGELQVEFITRTGIPNIPEIVITDGRGFKYYFGKNRENTESYHSYALRPRQYVSSSGMTSSMDSSTSTNVTAFRLYKITAPSRDGASRTVEFCYSSQRQRQRSVTLNYIKNESISGHYNTGDFNNMQNYPISGGFTEARIVNVNGVFFSLLESIKVDGQTIVTFSYEDKEHEEDAEECFCVAEHNSIDAVVLTGTYDSNPARSSKRLSGMTVKNQSGQTVDVFNFNHTYASRGVPKMFLAGVTGQRMGSYSFSYDLDGFSLPSNDTPNIDHWGYWNNRYVGKITDRITLTFGNPPSNIYAQINGNCKESDWRYSKCGALSRITYPTGGYSSVEYEANMVGKRITTFSSPQTCDPYEVGGIRVKRVSHFSPDGIQDNTSYVYSDSLNGASSGILNQMPLYAVAFNFDYSSHHHNGSFECSRQCTEFSNRCNCIPTRDDHIGYSSVITCHPDSSYVISTFSVSNVTYGDDYDYDGGSSAIHLLTIDDSFSARSSLLWSRLPTVDRKNVRGILLDERHYTPQDSLIRKVANTYSQDRVEIPRMYYSDDDEYVRASYAIASPILDNKVETSYEKNGPIETKTSFYYNSNGQPTWVSSSVTGGDSIWEYYHYLDSGTVPKSAKSAAIRTRKIDGEEYIIAKETYEYEPGNSRPVHIASYVIDTPVRITSSNIFNVTIGSPQLHSYYTYDTRFRLTRADYPGNAYIAYTWDGINISRKTVNGSDFTYNYLWKDLVGLTRQTAPTGQHQSYTYDDRNRLQYIRDVNGKAVEKYEYHTNNE